MMSKQAVSYTPQVVATELDVSSATLRRWSDEFSDHLSPEAGSTKGRSHRRYSDDDMAVLKTVKALMNQDGMTYAQVHEELGEGAAIWSDSPTISIEGSFEDEADTAEENSEREDGDELIPSESEANGLISANGSEATAIDFFTNTLATLSDNQKSILNSQAANRELLGVLIQDNFNLKEENTRLRDRLLEVERKMAQLHQDDEWRRENLRQELEAKINNAQHLATEALTAANKPQEMPEIKAVKSPPGCLGSLFGGGGDVQIVSVPPRKGRPKDKGHAAPPAAPTGGYSPGPQSSGPPAAHPKPMAPPE